MRLCTITSSSFAIERHFSTCNQKVIATRTSTSSTLVRNVVTRARTPSLFAADSGALFSPSTGNCTCHHDVVHVFRSPHASTCTSSAGSCNLKRWAESAMPMRRNITSTRTTYARTVDLLSVILIPYSRNSERLLADCGQHDIPFFGPHSSQHWPSSMMIIW